MGMILNAFHMVTLAPGWLELPAAYAESALAKGAGHKYIKRVPKAGGGYRYFYHVGYGGGVHSEAHFVEGASFRHEGGHYHITKVDGDKLTITHDETKESKSVTKAELGAMLAKHHEAGLKAHKEKTAAALAEARANKASPKQIARLEARAKAAGHEESPPRSKDYHYKKALHHYDTTGDALNQGMPKKVQDAHYSASLAHRAAENAHGKPEFESLSRAADAASERAEKLHAAAKAKAAADWKALMAPKANREKVATSIQARNARHPKVTAKHPGTGSHTVVFFAGKDGQPQEHAAKWRVVEASDVHASHLPGSGFKKNPSYPEGVQERVYHSDKAEQEKVLGNADRFRPEIVHNTNPDAVNGAPVVTEDGVVLGGNSRTMTMKHLYDTGRGAKVKDHLISEAHQFGLDRAAIAKMKEPILVREVSGVRADTTSKDDLKMLVRQANESFTQGMDPRADQVARALKLSDEAVASLAANLGEDETVGDFLGRASGAQRQFIEKLRTAGAIDRRNESQYMRPNGTLNEDGRNYVTKLFVGKLVPDPHLLSELPASTLNALAKSAPYILGAKAQGPKYDVTGDIRAALHAMVDMDMHGAKSLDEHLRQTSFALDGKSILGELEVAKSSKARRMFDVLTKNKGPNQMSGVFRDFARFAQMHPEGQTDLFGASTTAHDILDKAALKKGNAVYYGPRGGKYSDPEHKHSWSQDDKGGMQSDWVGDESAEKRAERHAKITAALSAWRNAAVANHKDPCNRKAYQGHEAALVALGEALNVGKGKEAIGAAQRWLRARGFKPDLKSPSARVQAPVQLSIV